MTERPRWVVFTSVGVIALLAGATVWLVVDRDASLPGIGSSAGAQSLAPDGSSPTLSAEGTGVLPDGTVLTASTSGAPSLRPIVDKPTPPVGGMPGDNEAPSNEQRAYLEQTRAIVLDNAPALTDTMTQIVTALGTSDAGTLSARVAPDEGGAGSFGNDLSERYPTILTSSPAANVNVFATGQATLYFTYAVVTWEDAGIVSHHTIPIVLRFVDGQWYLTTLGESAADLQFVQSITL